MIFIKATSLMNLVKPLVRLHVVSFIKSL